MKRSHRFYCIWIAVVMAAIVATLLIKHDGTGGSAHIAVSAGDVDDINRILCRIINNCDIPNLSINDDILYMSGSWLVGELVAVKMHASASSVEQVECLRDRGVEQLRLPQHIIDDAVFRMWLQGGDGHPSATMNWARLDSSAPEVSVWAAVNVNSNEIVLIAFASDGKALHIPTDHVIRDSIVCQKRLSAGVGDDWMCWHRVIIDK